MRLFLVTLSLIVLISAPPAMAGFLDDLKKQAAKAVEDGVKLLEQDETPSEETTDKSGSSSAVETPAPQQSAPKVAVTPAKDTNLVLRIQQRLNALGYDAGTPDGIYGNGTRKAIASYQSSAGIPADGQPSQALLDRLESTENQMAATSAPQSPPKATKSASLSKTEEYPEPTLGAVMLAAIHFRPEFIDSEAMLKRAILTIYPGKQQVVSNEFKWHKEKKQLEARLFEDAKNAPLVFDVVPWRNFEQARSIQVELMKYDFDKSAFLAQFGIGTSRNITPKRLMPGEPAQKYAADIRWAPVEPEKAEKIASSFGKGEARIGFLRYRLSVVGALPVASRPTAVVEIVDDKIDLYARRIKNKPAITEGDFEYFMTMPLPLNDVTEKVAAKSAADSSPAVKSVIASSNNKETAMAAMLGFTIDGVGLDKSFQEMKAVLEDAGYSGRLSPSSVTGDNIGDFKKARAVFKREQAHETGNAKDRRQVIIEFKNGKPKTIQYLISTPVNFDAAQWIDKVNGSLGEAVKQPCVPSALVKCAWQVVENGKAKILFVLDFSDNAQTYNFIFKRQDI
ncbi:MAG: peptidoglycan-binding protein [Sneathiella sp.]|nr:peptidoglycan-binding protein [Sneathiella sp.]